MKRIIITAVATLLAAVPVVMGLAGNTSFAQSVPVHVPSRAVVADNSVGPSKPVEPGDDKGGLSTPVKAGDDKGGLSTHAEPGDDKGGLTTHAEPGDDKGGLTTHAEPGDDKGGLSTPVKAGDDKGGLTTHTTAGDDRASDKSSGKGDNGGHVKDSSTSGKDDGARHS